MAERPAACPEWQEDLAGWLVAQISPEREAALTAHLEGCAACRAEASSLLAVAAATLPFGPTETDDGRSAAGSVGSLPAAAVAPPGGDRSRVGNGPTTGADAARAGDGSAADAGVSAGDDAAPLPPAALGERIGRAIAAERRSTRRLRVGAAALAAAAVVVVVALAWPRDDDPSLEGERVAFTVVPEGAEAAAVIAEEGDGSLVELTAEGLDPDVTYALWLSPPGGRWDDRIAGGTFRPDEDGTVDVRLYCALPVDEYGRVWVTTPEGEIALDTE